MSTPAEPAAGTRVGKNALIYALAFILQRAASFVMLPIYTRYFTTADYGVLQLLQTSLDVASILFSAGITAGLHRFYFATDDEAERRAVVVGSFWLLLGFNALGALALYAAAPVIAGHLLSGEDQARLVWIAATSFLLDATLTLPMLLLQARQAARAYAVMSLARLSLQLTMNVVAVTVLDLGIEGILWSTLITYVTLGSAMTIWMLRQTGLVTPRPLMARLYRFGLPYRLTAAGAFVLTYGDRYFLEGYWGVDEVGVYSLAYQFGFLLMSLGPSPFHLAWDPQRFQMAKRPESERNPFYSRGFFYFALVVVTLGVGISLFVRPLLTIMSAPAFHRAADLVPVVMAAFVCQSFGEVMDFGIQVSGKTIYTSISTWAAVATILVLYGLLIPTFGGLGAALATVGGFSVRWVLYRHYAQRLFPIAYRGGRALLLVVVGVLVVGVVVLLNPHGIRHELVTAVAGTLVYGGIAALIMAPPERAETLHFAMGLVRRVLRPR